MSIEIFHPAPSHPQEGLRQWAVEASGAMKATDDAVLLDIVQRARRLCNTRMAAITVLHQDWQWSIAAAGVAIGPSSRRTSFCGHVVAEPSAMLYVPDTLADPRFAGNPAVQGGQLVRFYAGVGLLDEDGLALGAMCVFDPSPRAPASPSPLADLRALAAEVVARLGRRLALMPA